MIVPGEPMQHNLRNLISPSRYQTMKLQHYSPLLIALLGASTVVLAAKVVTDYDRSAPFSQIKTFSWLDVKADPLWTDRIRQVVNQELQDKGLQQVRSGGDATLSAFASSATTPRIETYYNNFGGGWYWRGFNNGTATTTVEQLPVGTLVLDLFDTSNKKLIWRGVARDEISDKPEKNEKKLQKAVAEMFKKFPPKEKG